MTAKCVDAPSRPALKTVCPHLHPFKLFHHCLQNLVQYFKLAYIFSVWLQSFVIVLTLIDSCTCARCPSFLFQKKDVLIRYHFEVLVINYCWILDKSTILAIQVPFEKALALKLCKTLLQYSSKKQICIN